MSCNINQDILNGCLDYRTGGIDRIFILPFDDFQAVQTTVFGGSFSKKAFSDSFKNGGGGEYSTVLSTSPFYELQADDTSTFKNTFNNHHYTQQLTTKVRRIDNELDELLSKNKNKKFIVLIFPNLHNKFFEKVEKKSYQKLIENFAFTMGDEGGASWNIEMVIDQKTGDNVYNITFNSNSYKPLSVMSNFNIDSLVDYVLDVKFIPKEFLCSANTNFEVAQYAVAVTNDRFEYPVDSNNRLCHNSGNKQAIYAYINKMNDVDISNFDVIGFFDMDAVFEGRKVRRYNPSCYNYYNLQLKFMDFTETTLEELLGYAATTKTFRVLCTGRSGRYTATSNVNWIVPTIGADNTLTLKINENPEDSPARNGLITLVHNDKSDLKLFIKINQAKNIIVIPEFDYLVFRYFWADTDGVDLDTSTGYINTNIAFSDNTKLDELPVGWNMAGNYNTNAQNYLMFAGDNTGSGNECVYITMNSLITHFNNIPDIVNIDVYANWYRSRLNGNCEFELVAYKGGAMVQNGYNFDNIGGTEVLLTRTKVNIAATGNSNSGDFKTKYSKIGQINYDKNTRTATYVINAPIV